MSEGLSATGRALRPSGDLPLAGRTAVVTGGGSGIGRAIALTYARAGASLVLVGRREEPLRAVVAEIGEAGGQDARAEFRICDTSSPEQVDDLRDSLRDREVSILINNAGIAGPTADLVDQTPDAWDEVFAVNVRGVFLMCRAFLPAMTARGSGDVITLASVSGKRPLARRTPYTASKMALLGLTASLAFEVGPLGVMVNTLSPGPVDGDRMTGNFRRESEATGITVEQAEKNFTSRAALARMVTEDEVARAALAMLSMPGLCGADIDLSAGMIAR